MPLFSYKTSNNHSFLFDDLTSIRHNGKMNRQWSLTGLYSNLLQYLLIPRAQASLLILLSLSFLICYMQIALVKANIAHSIILIANLSHELTLKVCLGKGLMITHRSKLAMLFYSVCLSLQLNYFTPPSFYMK